MGGESYGCMATFNFGSVGNRSSMWRNYSYLEDIFVFMTLLAVNGVEFAEQSLYRLEVWSAKSQLKGAAF